MTSPFARPSDVELRAIQGLIKPWALLTRPTFTGLEHLPSSGPMLLVGNHTLYGVLDAPLLFLKLWEERGIFLRSLGDHLHFRVPLWRDMLSRYGVVDGTPAGCAALMEKGEAILVFPGGAREVSKRRGERYQLIWKERLGFARLAVAHGCPIVPFAAVGADDMFELLVDADDLLASPLGRVLERVTSRADVLLPIARHPLPRLERFYFWVGAPIPTVGYGGDTSPSHLREVRDLTRSAVEGGLASLLAAREADPGRLLRLGRLGRLGRG